MEDIGLACLGVPHPHSSVRLEVARRLEGYKLIGVADRDPDLAPNVKALAEHLDIEVMSVNEILTSDDVTAVFIESWTEEMVGDTLACIDAGKHVLVEKPAGLNTTDIGRYFDPDKTSDVVVQVGYNFRFSPMVEMAKQMVEDGTLGKLVQARVHAAGPAGDAHYRWYNLPGDVGGTFWEDGCHVVDLLIHLFGMPVNATACVSKFDSISGSDSREDAAVAALEYEDKLVSFDFTAWESNDWIETWEFSLYGTEGTLCFRLVPEEFRLFMKEARGPYKKGWNSWRETTFAVPWAGEPEPWDEWHVVANKSFFKRELAEFRDAIRGTAENPIDLVQAWNIAAVMEACFESSEGGSVRVPVKRMS